ncbi:MAG TPA: ATP12 family protein [Rhizomicrobium sp.]|nr:ATP12 family protein [Rhizomicrobium sp.]
MTRSHPKRSYKTATAAASGENFEILLDEIPARIGTTPLRLPTRALADAIAQEWREQGEVLDPERMRLTGLAGSALTKVSTQRGAVIEHVLGYGRNELLCYRAAEPPELIARQNEQWDVLLEWAHLRRGIRFVADSGISFIEQPVDALLRMQEIVSDCDNFELAALDAAATLASSFVVALALVEGHINAEEAFAVSHLDELFQAQKWGRDANAELRRARILTGLKAVERFVSLID